MGTDSTLPAVPPSKRTTPVVSHSTSVGATGSALERRATAVMARSGGLVTPVGVIPVPDGPIGLRVGGPVAAHVSPDRSTARPTAKPGLAGRAPLRADGKRTEWVVTAAETDPQLRQQQFVMPDHVVAKLERLVELGVEFDRLFVAHELPDGSLKADVQTIDPTELAALIPETPPSERTRRALRIATSAARVSLGGVVAPVVAAGLAPVAAAAALGAATAGLDPALLGVVSASGRARTGELSVWFLIEAWR